MTAPTPPPGSLPGSLHWLRIARNDPTVGVWQRNEMWRVEGVELPYDMRKAVEYIAPAIPPHEPEAETVEFIAKTLWLKACEEAKGAPHTSYSWEEELAAGREMFRKQARAAIAAMPPAVTQPDTFAPTHRHYKGGLYQKMACGIHTDTDFNKELTIYRDAEGQWFCRPSRLFNGFVDLGQHGVRRFDPLPMPIVQSAAMPPADLGAGRRAGLEEALEIVAATITKHTETYRRIAFHIAIQFPESEGKS